MKKVVFHHRNVHPDPQAQIRRYGSPIWVNRENGAESRGTTSASRLAGRKIVLAPSYRSRKVEYQMTQKAEENHQLLFLDLASRHVDVQFRSQVRESHHGEELEQRAVPSAYIGAFCVVSIVDCFHHTVVLGIEDQWQACHLIICVVG